MAQTRKPTDKRMASNLAKAAWRTHPKEQKALVVRKHVERLGRVDQIWQWLKEHYGEVLAVDAPHATHPESYTYSELAERISTAAAAFQYLGLKAGDVAALFAENSPRWLVADQGLMRVGAADAVRGASAPIEELRYILEDSGAIALLIQNAQLWEKLALTESQRKQLILVVQLEGEPAEGVLSWEALLAAGSDKQTPNLFNDRRHDSAGSTIATVLYTSGTTGKPKGVPLSHSNLLHQMRSLACVAHPLAGSPVLSVLPIWHAYERSAEYYFFSCACTQSYTTIKQLKRDLPRVRPVVMVTVPRLWEAVKAGFDDVVRGMPSSRQVLLRMALANSGAYKMALRKSRALLLDTVAPINRLRAVLEVLVRSPMHALTSALLWPKVLKQLCGGRLRFPINGGGAIAPHVDSFFEALGVELLVGYGLTETSPVVSCRRPWRNIRGSSGPPLPHTEFRIVDPENGSQLLFRQRGRVLVRGPQVMEGYLNRPEETANVLDADGWFDTGDLGMILPDGSLVLTGRAKDTIVLSNGENIEPGPLEEELVASPLIDQVLLVGQDERQLGALVVPNFELMMTWAKDQGLNLSGDFAESPGDQSLRRALHREINVLLAQRPGSRLDERVIGVALVAPFTIENGLLTQTLKQRRDRISSRDELAIAAIYAR